MPEQTVVREPARPKRRAVRAAAVVVLATGASGVVAQLAPLYGPLYAYVAALIAIAWLEGVFAGLIGAVAALAAYVLLFDVAKQLTPRSWIIVGALTAAVLIAIAILRRARRPATPEVKPVAAAPVVESDGEADAVRAQLVDALAKLYEANQARTAEAAAGRAPPARASAHSEP